MDARDREIQSRFWSCCFEIGNAKSLQVALALGLKIYRSILTS